MKSVKKPVVGVNMLYKYLKANNHHFYVVIDEYVDNIYQAGGFPLLIPTLDDIKAIPEYLDRVDAMVFVGGPDYHPEMYHAATIHPQTQLHRKRAEFDLALMKAALERKIPILGICAGCQLLAIASGGRLIQHIDGHEGGVTHPIVIENKGYFSSIMELEVGDRAMVNSFHHQAVDPDQPGHGLQIAARNLNGIVEVIERTDDPMVIGLQFHVERMPDLAPRFFRKLTV